MIFLAVFLAGIAVGLVLGVAVAVRGQRLDDEFHEELDLHYNRLLDQERAEEAALDRLAGWRGIVTVHRFHPNPDRGDPPNAILFDQCPRCLEHAKDPRGLDRENLAAIVKVCRDGYWDHVPTEAERQAESSVYRALCLVEMLTGLPWRTLVEAGLGVPE